MDPRISEGIKMAIKGQESPFKPGDVVKLKSGGPTMTVANVGLNAPGYLEVIYFNHQGDLNSYMLPWSVIEAQDAI